VLLTISNNQYNQTYEYKKDGYRQQNVRQRQKNPRAEDCVVEAFYPYAKLIFGRPLHLPRLSQGRTQGRPKCVLGWLKKLTHVPLAIAILLVYLCIRVLCKVVYWCSHTGKTVVHLLHVWLHDSRSNYLLWSLIIMAWMSSGSAFYADGPTCEKARSPNLVRTQFCWLITGLITIGLYL